MDKGSCLNPESIAGVLKTIYLFLEGQNFRQTCDTFLNETQLMGYAEFKKAIARILVLKPSYTEVVKVSHADPAKSEHQIQADLPVFMDAGVQDTPSKNICIYYGEPLCIDRPECSTSAPQLAGGVCPCKPQSACKQGGVNIVETMDNTKNDMETERILKKAVRDEVRVAPPPPPDTSESAHSKKDKRINFKQSAQVFVQPENLVTVVEKDHMAESLSTSFPRKFSLRRNDELEEEEEEDEDANAFIAPDKSKTVGKQPSHHVGHVQSESKVVAKSVSKLERSREPDDEEVLLRTEDYKGTPSLASVRSKASEANVPHEELRATRSAAIARSYQSMQQRPSATSVRFDINGRVIDPTSSVDQKQSVARDDVDALEESHSAAPSAASIAHSAARIAPSKDMPICPSTGTVCPASRTSLHTDRTSNMQISDINLAGSRELDVCPSTGGVCPASQTSLLPAEPSRKSIMTQRMSACSMKASKRSMAPLGSAPSRYVDKGTINIASCLPKSAPVQSHSMATSTDAMKCVESSTEGIRTICRSISCSPNLVERSASTRSLKGRSELDYIKVKKELRSGCPSVKIILLQALRWKITRAADDDSRNDTISNYARHDLLSLHGTPSGGHRSIVEAFLCTVRDKTATNQEEGMARMVNVMASLTLGRDYLCQDESLLTKLIIPLVMDVYPYKAQTTDVTKEHLLVALQKLSLRNNMRLVMIQAGLPEYLVFYLSARHNTMSDYCLEYCLALFMNLCLHSETHMRLKKKSKDVVKFITDFLSAGHQSCLSYLNSAMYNLFLDPDIRKEAKSERLDATISDKSQTVDEETKQQMEVVIDLLNMNKQSTPCIECGCIDQDDEVDHLEAELESGDSAKGDPNGEDLLRLYQSRAISPGSNAVPLTCTCRPITPRKKISASEKCPAPPTPVSTAQASAMSVEPEKKAKKHKFCFGICGKKKEKVPESSPLKDEEHVLASEECPRGDTTCCAADVEDECIPTREATPSNYAHSRVSICASVLAYDPSANPEESKSIQSRVGSTVVQRSISRQSVIEEPSKTTTVDEQITERTETFGTPDTDAQETPMDEVEQSNTLISPSRQESLRQGSVTSCASKQSASVLGASRQRSMLSRQQSLCSRQQSMGSRRLSRTLICSEKENDPCIEKCTGRQETLISRQSIVSKCPSAATCPSRQRISILNKDPSVASRLSMQKRDMIVEEPSLIASTSRQSVLQEEPSLTSCPSRQASLIKSASCGSINPSKEPSMRSCRSSNVRMSLASVQPSQSKQSLKKEPSLMRSLTDDAQTPRSPRGSNLNLVTEDKSVQESRSDITESNNKRKSQACRKCCAAKPKKQESRMSTNLESEITIEDEDYEPDESCAAYSQKAVSEKSVATVSCYGNSTASKGVLAKEPSAYVPPSFTRSVINNQARPKSNQDTYNWCNQQRQSPCPPCVTSGYYSNANTCATNYMNTYPTCYKEPSQYNYYNKAGSCTYSCPQNQQQRNRYSCECYNNVKTFVQNSDVCDPTRSYSQSQQLQNRSRPSYQ